MMGEGPTRENRVGLVSRGMLEHHGGALMMAHDASPRAPHHDSSLCAGR